MTEGSVRSASLISTNSPYLIITSQSEVLFSSEREMTTLSICCTATRGMILKTEITFNQVQLSNFIILIIMYSECVLRISSLFNSLL